MFTGTFWNFSWNSDSKKKFFSPWRIKMQRYLPLLLLLAVISASLFMIVESGEYYSTFYENIYQGYWASFLVEAFLALSAMLYFADRKFLNLCIKVVMIPLFLVVVGGASLKIVSPMMDRLATANTKNKLLEFLDQESQQSKVHLALFKGQKTNTALAIKHQRNISNQLITELQNQKTRPWMIWIVIGFSTFLRFSVQLANLIFAHSLGIIWRDNFGIKPNKNLPKISPNSENGGTRRGRPLGSKNKTKKKARKDDHRI